MIFLQAPRLRPLVFQQPVHERRVLRKKALDLELQLPLRVGLRSLERPVRLHHPVSPLPDHHLDAFQLSSEVGGCLPRPVVQVPLLAAEGLQMCGLLRPQLLHCVAEPQHALQVRVLDLPPLSGFHPRAVDLCHLREGVHGALAVVLCGSHRGVLVVGVPESHCRERRQEHERLELAQLGDAGARGGKYPEVHEAREASESTHADVAPHVKLLQAAHRLEVLQTGEPVPVEP